MRRINIEWRPLANVNELAPQRARFVVHGPLDCYDCQEERRYWGCYPQKKCEKFRVTYKFRSNS